MPVSSNVRRHKYPPLPDKAQAAILMYTDRISIPRHGRCILLYAILFATLLNPMLALSQEETDWDEVNRRLLSKAPEDMRNLSIDDFCAGYGNAIRMKLLPNGYDGDEAPRIMKEELKRRKIKLNETDAQKETIRIGITKCQLLASWGTPRDQNRSVGSWGVHIQHIYPGTYVYTKNGIVTSYQD